MMRGKIWRACVLAFAIAVGAAPMAGAAKIQAKSVETRTYATELPSRADIQKQIDATASYLLETVTDPICGSIGGEWSVIGLARAGKMTDAFKAKYQANLKTALDNCEGALHAQKYTEYSRVTIAASALGMDAGNVFGYNMLQKLADYDRVVWQGVNGPIYALIALDTKQYTIPAAGDQKTQTTRENLIACILGKQNADGGWAISGTASESDTTAMALQSLAPYGAQANVRQAVNRALNWLGSIQNADGTYSMWGDVTLESGVQVLTALSTLRIGADDPRFVKNGFTVVDGILAFANADGSFRHLKTGDANLMATEQALYGLTAYGRYLDGKNALYDMTAEKDHSGESWDSGATVTPPADSNTPGDTGSNGSNGNTDSNESSGNAGSNGSSGNTGSNGGSAGETAPPAAGTSLTDGKTGQVYTVNKGGSAVSYKKPKNKTVTTATVPATVTLGGKSYQVTAIAAGAFSGCTKLKTVSIGKHVTGIGTKAFYGCKALTKVTIPSKVTTIGSQVFSGCTVLKTATIGKNVTSLGTQAFYGCKALTKITIPGKVKTIGSQAFSGCTGLTKATIGNAVTSIGKKAFYGCKKLKNITINTTKLTTEKVGAGAFKGIYAKASIKAPKSKKTTYTKLLKAKGIGKNVKIK